MEKITSLEVSPGLISSASREKVRAIRELANGYIIDVRQLAFVSNRRVNNSGKGYYTIGLKSGPSFDLDITEQERDELVDYWRYHNGL